MNAFIGSYLKSEMVLSWSNHCSTIMINPAGTGGGARRKPEYKAFLCPKQAPFAVSQVFLYKVPLHFLRIIWRINLTVFPWVPFLFLISGLEKALQKPGLAESWKKWANSQFFGIFLNQIAPNVQKKIALLILVQLRVLLIILINLFIERFGEQFSQGR